MSFRICTVGCGSMSTAVHGPSHAKYARLHPDVELAACCDLREDVAAAYQARFGYQRRYADVDQMLASERPDAVCVYMPVELTGAVVSQVVGQGYPTFCEKPPGLTVDELARMLAAAGDTPTQVAFNRRFAPLVREAVRLRPDRLQHVRYDMVRVGRHDADFSTTAVHAIDAVRHLAGADYQQVRFSRQPFAEFGPTVANVFIDGELANGATVHLAFCPVAGVTIERAVLHGDGATVLLDVPVPGSFDGRGRVVRLEAGQVAFDGSGEQISDGPDSFEEAGFYAENAAFFDDLRAGRRPACDLRSAWQSVALMEAYRNGAAAWAAAGQ